MIFEDFKSNGAFGDKWNLKCYYLLRRTERKEGHSLREIRNNLRDTISVYNFVDGNTDRKYLLALKYLQQDIIKPVTTRTLTINTIGDINKY